MLEVGEAPGPVNGKRRGLYHVGWHIGDSLETLKQCKQKIKSLGFSIKGCADHTISKSLYLLAPDGNEIELYIDAPQYDWQQDNSWMSEPVKPLIF